MSSYLIATLFGFAAFAALATLVGSVRRALPQAATLRGELARCSDTMEMRFKIVEVTAAFNDGKVVQLPFRPRPVASQGLRAAA